MYVTNKSSRDALAFSSYDVHLTPEIVASIRGVLPRVSDEVVAAITEDVPAYRDAFSGPMGETIRTAVGIALSGFLSLASVDELPADVVKATPPALEEA